MTVDLERKDGRWHFSLGTVEKWVVTTGAAVLVAAGYWFVSSVTVRLDAQSKALGDLATQQAVTNSQLVTLNLQLADVPSLTRKMAELEVRVDRNAEDIRELRGTRNLR